MGSYSSTVIQCPFYLSDDPKSCSITCEGMLPGSSIKSHFMNGAAFRRQIGKYCAGDYKSCPWATVLSKVKYEE